MAGRKKGLRVEERAKGVKVLYASSYLNYLLELNSLKFSQKIILCNITLNKTAMPKAKNNLGHSDKTKLKPFLFLL